MIPTSVFGLSFSDTEAQASKNIADPVPEVEDENSDINLKFLPPETSNSLSILKITFVKTDEVPPSGFVEEIPTPPPLL